MKAPEMFSIRMFPDDHQGLVWYPVRDGGVGDLSFSSQYV